MTFDPEALWGVSCIVVQRDRRILLGGDFAQLGGFPRRHIGRINSDGTVDAAFDREANQPVLTLAVLPDGKIIAGGKFTTLGGTSRNFFGAVE